MGKYFDDIQQLPQDHPTYLFFERGPTNEDLSPAAASFKNDIHESTRVLRNVVNPPQDRFEELLGYFHHAACIGLGGDNPNLELGRGELVRARYRLVDIAQKTRVKSFIKWSVIIGLACTTIGVLGAILPGTMFMVEVSNELAGFIRALFCALIGIGVSVFFMAFYRSVTVSYHSLSSSTYVSFRPFHSLGYIGAATVVIMIILYFDVIMLGAGNMLLNDFKKDPRIAIIIGLIGGVATSAFIDIIFRALEARQRDTPGGQEGRPA